MQRRGLGLLLAGAAAYGYYKYSRMTPQQKADLRQRGKSFFDKNLGSLGNLFGKRRATETTTNGSF